MSRIIFVGGGVMSGVGKGIATSSIGKILQGRGFKVTAIKIDPYVNIDAGTMNPIEHGEVFVTNDALECDQDIGNYERFLSEEFTQDNYMTTGRVYLEVIKKERNLEYGGKCVEVVPHIPNEVIARIKRAGRRTKADFVLVEIGGTVGEYQNLIFLEAARMMCLKNPNKVLFVMVTYLPVPKSIGEMKTKPTQNAVRILNEAGIQPDIIIGRSEFPLDEPRKKKISVFCNIDPKDVVSSPDTEFLYEIPLNFEKEGLSTRILNKFNMRPKKKDLKDWESMVNRMKNSKKPVKVAIVGKYFQTGDFVLTDSYLSVIEAIKHASWNNMLKPEIEWFSAEEYEKNPSKVKELKDYDGIIIPGGFGSRGIEGKIKVIEFCRENNIPFLGLCLGMQMAVIEFARNICGIKDANSSEIDPKCSNPVITLIGDQVDLINNKKYGATMRLGAYPCILKDYTISYSAYKTKEISERHRHRYELNNDYRTLLESKGLIMAGINPERDLVEIIELKNHPFFVGTQFHPEFKSTPLVPHPLFNSFILACKKRAN
ncbi:MAG: CTP synthase [Parcubacteria group bacterium ADurb.Bin247]|nr:MAG: CTP synthase [Parcubacteria group bacterium ADurb.Bin247]